MLNMAKFKNGDEGTPKNYPVVAGEEIKLSAFKWKWFRICLYSWSEGAKNYQFSWFVGTLITLKSCPCINN